jgi:thioredoxin-dependent peroxiredoxin
MTTTNLQLGEKAPDFAIPNDESKPISLKDFLGKPVILYFYPKDDTPGCAQEACDFRDSLTQLSAQGAVVMGISKDNVKSHQKFKEKHNLPFMLLSDVSKEVCEKYQVMVEKSRYGKKYLGIERSTFLIDTQGVIRGIWRNVKVEGHVGAVLEHIKKL